MVKSRNPGRPTGKAAARRLGMGIARNPLKVAATSTLVLEISNGEISFSESGVSGLGASFICVANTSALASERALAATAPITLSDGGAGGSITVALADTAVTPGAYTYASITVDQKGRITSAANGTAPAATNEAYVTIGNSGTLSAERALAGTAGEISLTDGGANSSATLALVATAVTPGSYTNTSLTVDSKGRVTAAASGTAPAVASEAFVTIGNSSGLSAERALAVESSVLALADGGANGSATISVAANGITDAKLRQSAALSLVGRSANSTGNVGDISATATSGAVLRESGSAIGFGAVATAGIAANAVTDAKLRQSAGVSVIGRSANSTGDVADITATADGQVLSRAAGALTWATPTVYAATSESYVVISASANLSAERTLAVGQGLSLSDAGANGAVTLSPTIMRGYIDGLILSNNGSDANNDIDIAAGIAADSTGVRYLSLAASITKRLDASWAVGTNQGGIDTGSEANSTWYHMWLIQRSDTGVVDVLFSTSATAPTMPANYDFKRRIGSVYNNGSGNLRAFKQNGEEFLWNAFSTDVNITNPGTSAVNRTLLVPTGVKVTSIAIYSAFDTNTTASQDTALLVSPTDVSDEAASATVSQITAIFTATSYIVRGNAELRMRTDTSGQVRTRFYQFSDADIGLTINTRGWIDTRGRDA